MDKGKTYAERYNVSTNENGVLDSVSKSFNGCVNSVRVKKLNWNNNIAAWFLHRVIKSLNMKLPKRMKKKVKKGLQKVFGFKNLKNLRVKAHGSIHGKTSFWFA